jgi:hypothetical protein
LKAAVSPLPREEEVQSKVRKIRTFSRNARVVCAVLVGLALILSVLVFFLALRSPVLPITPPRDNAGVYDILTSLTPLQTKAWALVSVTLGIGIWLVTLFQLYRLFGNLAAGEIHTPANVRRVRIVGLLWLLLAVLKIIFPAVLVAVNSFSDTPVSIDLDRVFPSFSELSSSFAAAGLILLVSWILDVGLYEKQHADALRRDADLVI